MCLARRRNDNRRILCRRLLISVSAVTRKRRGSVVLLLDLLGVSRSYPVHAQQSADAVPCNDRSFAVTFGAVGAKLDSHSICRDLVQFHVRQM
jgi:hypothetical protein